MVYRNDDRYGWGDTVLTFLPDDNLTKDRSRKEYQTLNKEVISRFNIQTVCCN